MPCCKKYRIALLLLLALGNIAAQDTLSFQNVESGTYRLFESKSWSGLEELGDNAIKKGFDYYYLRIRTGIAAYELKHYRIAIMHFKKAMQFNSEDNLAAEYLYYCYLYVNREEDARTLSKTFGKEFASYMKTKKLNPVSYIFAEGGVKLPDSIGRFMPAAYGQVGVNHYIKRRISLFHVFTYYAQNESRFTVKQLQYYLRGSIPLKNDWLLTAGAHLVYDNSVVTDHTAKQYTVQELPTLRTASNIVTTRSYEESLGLVASAGLTKHLPLADLSFGATALFIDTARQYQADAGIVLYPMRNNNFSIGLNSYLHTEDRTHRFDLAFAPVLSMRVAKGLRLNINYFANRGLNISEQNGYFVNNSYDFTLHRITVSPSYLFSSQLTVYAIAGLEEKREVSGEFNYHYLIFSLGLRFNPFKNHI